MRYSAILVFKRVGDQVYAYRVSSAHDHVTVVLRPMHELYQGHCTHVGNLIAESEARYFARTRQAAA